MKSYKKIVACLVLCLALAASLLPAAAFADDPLTVTLDDGASGNQMVFSVTPPAASAASGTAVLTSVTGSAGKFSLPASISDGGISYAVVAIGDEAFLNNTALTQVEFGKLDSIGNGAFKGCSSLSLIRSTGSVAPSLGSGVFDDSVVSSAKLELSGNATGYDAEGWPVGLVRLFSASGTVKDKSGNGVANATVSVSGKTVLADASGNFETGSCLPGDQQVELSAASGIYFGSTAVDVAQENVQNVVITLELGVKCNTASLSFGTVTLGYSPVTAKNIELENLSFATLTAPEISVTSGNEPSSFNIGSFSGDCAGQGLMNIPVSPKDGLGVGVYSETLTVSVGGETLASFPVSVTVAAPFKISYNANGGTGTMPASTAGVDGSLTLPENGFTAPYNKVFKEWAVGSTSGDKVAAKAAYTFTSDSEVFAVWKNKYSYISGSGSSWVNDSAKDLSFTVDGDFSKFTGVSVDGAALSADKYTSASGSTVVALKNAYLKTLSVGKHTISVKYNDGSADTGFTVVDAKDVQKPATGDSSALGLWGAALVSALCGFGLCSAVLLKKHRR